MQPDLQAIQITDKDFKESTGISLVLFPLQRPKRTNIRRFLAIFLFVLAIIVGIAVARDGEISADFIIISLANISFLGFLIYLMEKNYNLALKRYKELEPLRCLLMEVQKYNSIVRGIDIRDQLESIGNKGIELEDRSRILEALDLTRKDLIRALKTERILRENKDFITQNPQVSASNLATLEAIKIRDQASEWGQLFSQTVQIAISVQEEMQRLQAQG